MGSYDGVSSALFIGVIVVACVFVLAILVISIINGVKEEKRKTAESAAGSGAATLTADTAAAQQAAAEPEVKEEIPAPIIEEPVQEPAAEEAAASVEPIVEPEPVKEEPVLEPEPVKEEAVPEPEPVKEEPIEEPKQEEAAAEPVKEEEVPEKKPVKPAAAKKVVKKKPDDWSKYDGEYAGYYYDPEDACYYEGKPSAELAKKLAAKKAELDAATVKAGKKVVIKKIAPPFATLKTPKHPRQTPQKVAGFDEADIYGKYVIEHVGDEYFYTLYSNKEASLYESGNYSTLEYCKSAIQRFKTHALVGVFTIEEKDGKFNFVLKRKSYSHRGVQHDTLVDAEQHKKDVKYFAQTDIVREI